jgi:hypothetical protein
MEILKPVWVEEHYKFINENGEWIGGCIFNNGKRRELVELSICYKNYCITYAGAELMINNSKHTFYFSTKYQKKLFDSKHRETANRLISQFPETNNILIEIKQILTEIIKDYLEKED